MTKEKGKPIRDPIHNYISVTPIEKEIIDTPDFQRLRFVYQNSTAQLTYPNANNCRFLHSLGAMHLSGRILLHALKNSDAEILVHFLQAFDKIIENFEFTLRTDSLYSSWQNTIGNASRFFHNPKTGSRVEFSINKDLDKYKILVGNSDKENHIDLKHDPYFLINTAWQAVRVVGLVHDIGHFPMSHLFENAIAKYQNEDTPDGQFQAEVARNTEQYVSKISERETKEIKSNDSISIHEFRGLFIFGKLNSSSQEHYYGLIYRLASHMLAHNPDSHDAQDEETNIIRCLHRLVAGEIDADRLDYCVRDAHASGLEFGAIDIERIVTNMILCKNDQDEFFIIPTDNAISAVESFFHQRYLLYKYEIYHHNVARFDGLLENILSLLLKEGYTTQPNNREVVNLLNILHFINTTATGDIRYLPDEYSAIYDDSWLRALLSEVLIILDKSEKTEWSKMLSIMINTFIYRQTENLLSFWKRDSDVIGFLNENFKGNIDIESLCPLTLNNEPEYKRDLFDLFVGNLSNDLGDDVLVISKKLKPKIHNPDDLSSSIFSRKKVRKVEEISPYIASLNYSIVNVPDIHISILCEKIKQKEKNNIRKKAEKSFKKRLLGYVLDLEKRYIQAEKELKKSK